MPERCEFCEEIQRQSLESSKEKPKLTTAGKWILGLFGATLTGVFAITTPFILPAMRKICLPYVPATPNQIRNVLKLLGNTKRTMVDLGSGDGRIVIEAAKRGFTAHGVELNPWLVWYARLIARRQGVHRNVKFYRKDMFKTDFQKYDHVVVFGVDSLMEPLENALAKRARSECSVIVCRYPFPNWSPIKTEGEGIDAVWLYKIEKGAQVQEVHGN